MVNNLNKGNMTTKEVIDRYYAGIEQKNGWQSVIADDIIFSSGGQISNDNYVTATSRFLNLVKASKVRELIIEGNKACAIVSYEIQSPKGNLATCDVAEILTVHNGKINSSSIFFDTGFFRNFLTQ